MRRADEKLQQADALAALILTQVQELRTEIAAVRHDLAIEYETPELMRGNDDG